MASRLLPLPVVVIVMVMVSLLALLLQSSAMTEAVPHIEMVRGSRVDKYNRNNNDYCDYGIAVSSADSDGIGIAVLSFDLYDKYGNSTRVQGLVHFQWDYDLVIGFGPCINRPCKLVVTEETEDGKGHQYIRGDGLINSVQVKVEGGGNDNVKFINTAKQWIGPESDNMQLQISNCDTMQ